MSLATCLLCFPGKEIQLPLIKERKRKGVIHAYKLPYNVPKATTSLGIINCEIFTAIVEMLVVINSMRVFLVPPISISKSTFYLPVL